mgnify:CR=1 FL=1|tara:strand:+ start:55 stop:288 length:234 start_codon:yes stop_codon:yes gene_type:complete
MSENKAWNKSLVEINNQHPYRCALLFYGVVLGGMYLGRIVSTLAFDFSFTVETLKHDLFVSVFTTLFLLVFKAALKS